MKLKYITFAAIVIFVGVFFILLFNPPEQKMPEPAVVQSANTDVSLTKDNVAKHSDEKSCYLIVKGKVYDVTSYIPDHPGGRRKIIEMCGREATTAFSAIHDNFAWNLLAKYYIGDLAD